MPMLLSKERRIRATLIKENADGTELVDVDVVGLANDGNTCSFALATQKAEDFAPPLISEQEQRLTELVQRANAALNQLREFRTSLGVVNVNAAIEHEKAARKAAKAEQEAARSGNRVIRLRDEEGQ